VRTSRTAEVNNKFRTARPCAAGLHNADVNRKMLSLNARARTDLDRFACLFGSISAGTYRERTLKFLVKAL
jgi:hypothetical protein